MKAAMPFLNDVVVSVKDALLKEFKNDGGRNNLKAVEYTFFCGTYPVRRAPNGTRTLPSTRPMTSCSRR